MAQHAFLQEDYGDAALFAERARRAQPPDPTDKLEIESFLMILKDLVSSRADATTAEDEEAEEEDLITPDITFLTTRGLYWPPNAQVLLADLIASMSVEN
jgi:hypothetical protein